MIGKVMALVFVAMLFIAFAVSQFYVRYQYEKQIGSYMGNAADMISPEQMLEQVQKSKQGMIDAGLKEEDYGALIFKKPDNSMKFQYQHIDAIIERINSVIDWKNKIASNSSSAVETMGDVYETKMTNLRNYITSETSGSITPERSDWIAKKAWYLKYNMIYYFGWLIDFIFIVMLIAIVCFIVVESNYRY